MVVSRTNLDLVNWTWCTGHVLCLVSCTLCVLMMVTSVICWQDMQIYKLSQAWSIVEKKERSEYKTYRNKKLSVSQHFREYFRDTCIFNQGELEGGVNWLWLHYIGDLHLVLPELNLSILNACILILVQDWRQPFSHHILSKKSVFLESISTVTRFILPMQARSD